ncbi:MAG: NAD/NADP octopine/nopaline dehydrogenase family protein [Pseudorhodobacter sp.]
MTKKEKYRIGIAGAGSVALGNAAFLEDAGHEVMLWSPSGKRTAELAKGAPLLATGAVEGEFHPAIAASAQVLCEGAEIILLALPAYGHRVVMEALAPHLRSDHLVIISSHASLGALYLGKLLAERGISLPIVAWGTTMTTGRAASGTEVKVNTVRARLDMCTVPVSRSAEGLAVCRALFGDRFVERDGLLAISLSNLNPQNHLGIALGNITRMEKGEIWSQGEHVTPLVGRLLEALDAERLAIAGALGLEVRTIFEHFHLSFHVPVASISEMNQKMHRKGNGGIGPATADSRYVTEDVPYGLALTVALGDLVGHPAVLHKAGIDIFSAMYGRDFTAENDLLAALNLDEVGLDDLRNAAQSGILPP